MTPPFWLPAAVTYALSLWLFTLVGAPTSPLFAALLGGGVLSLRSGGTVTLPTSLRTVGMTLVGVAAGATIDAEVLLVVAQQPVAVLGGVVFTLVATMAIGQLLRLQRDVSSTTATFASIAGGASGISMMADQFGADAPVVMAVQYLRVVVILISVPLIAPLLGGGDGSVPPGAAGAFGLTGLGFTVTAVVTGLVLGRFVRFSASEILIPLAVASGLAVWGVFPSAVVPGWVVAIGYTVVGLNVGLGFTSERLRRLVRLFPTALLQTVLGVAVCAVVGTLFASAVGVSPLDGYLATSPGGFPAVVAVALDSGAEIGLILTMQVMRVFLALFCAPVVGAWLNRKTLGDA